MQQVLHNIRKLKLGALLFLILGALLFLSMGEILLFEYIPNVVTEFKGGGQGGLFINSMYLLYAFVLVIIYPATVFLMLKKHNAALFFIFIFLIWNICGCLFFASFSCFIYTCSFNIEIILHYSVLIFVFINIMFMMYFYYNRNVFK